MYIRNMVATLLFLFCVPFGFCEAPLALASLKDGDRIELNENHLVFFLDTSDSYGISELASSSVQFAPLDSDRLGLLDQDHDIWLRFTVSPTAENNRSWIIAGWPESFQITLYEPIEGDGFPGTTGWKISGDTPGKLNDAMAVETPTSGTTRSFLITPSPTSPKRYYLRIGLRPGWFTGISISSIDTFIDHTKPETLFYGIFYGILLAMFVYNLMLYRFIRDVTYLWYVAYLLGMAIYFLRQNGYLFLLFPHLSTSILHSIGLVSMALGMVFAVSFTVQFLRIDNTRGNMLTLARGLQLAWILIAMLGLFIPQNLVSRLNSIGGILTILLLLGFVFIRIKQKFQYARYYLIAFGVLAVAEIFYILVPFRLLPITRFTTSLFQIGTGLELLLLSLALGFRIKMLQDSMNTFRKGAEELKRINSLDPLSGLLNRRTFNRVLDAVSHNYRTSRKTYSVLFIDIDNFKYVNDTYGHPCGDKVISGVADVIQSALRETDQPFRYGGEEFVVILPGSDKKTAAIIGERIRATVEKTEFYNHCEETISITISTGVSEISSNEPSAQLIQRADEALYQAKKKGKNRVVVS